MEEILASIKRIIAEDGDDARAVRRAAPARPVAVPDVPAAPAPMAAVPDSGQIRDVLELTNPAPADPRMAAVASSDGAETLLSESSAEASRHALDALSAVMIQGDQGTGGSGGAMTLDSLVTEMLRPLLKQWLDQNLPEIVEAMVQREISRITNR